MIFSVEQTLLEHDLADKPNQVFNLERGVPIIVSTDISATNSVIFTTSVIGTTITQPADINTDYSACEIYFI